MIETATKTVGRPRRPLLVRVQVRLCSSHCAGCKAEHWSEPLGARRMDQFYVRITQPHPVWFNAPAYGSLAIRYVHQFIDHATRYVDGLVHVNGVENFWSLLKRMLHGTYVAVASFHLQRYVDEEAFRFNQRDTNDAGRFAELLLRVVGRRLTYRRLTAQGDAGFMGIR